MIWVTPLSQLERTIRNVGARYVLSLTSVGSEPARPESIADENYLGLSMHDIAEPRPGCVAPSVEHVVRMVEFGRCWNRQGALVIHCYAGISRSTAAAYVIAAALQPERDEAELAAHLRQLSPAATPNPLVIAHADGLLDRRGRMIDAIRAIGRGADAYEGTPFCLD